MILIIAGCVIILAAFALMFGVGVVHGTTVERDRVKKNLRLNALADLEKPRPETTPLDEDHFFENEL